MCCRSKKCFARFPFNPLDRFDYGRIIEEHKKRYLYDTLNTTIDYLDNFVEGLGIFVLVLSFVYIYYYILIVRDKVANQWSDDVEYVDPVLFAMAEKPDMTIVKIGHRDLGGYPISGQHSLIAYCRLLAASACRDHYIKESQLVNPDILRARILRNNLRIAREKRKKMLLQWRIANSRLNRKKKYVLIDGKWIYISKKMKEEGFLENNYRIQQKKAIQNALAVQKLHIKLVTKTNFDLKYIKYFDQYDICHLKKLCRNEEHLYMIMFQAVGLGHLLFQVKRPMGTVKHKNVFEAMYFHGPYFYPWQPNELIALFNDAKELFSRDRLCLKLALPIVIIGEIRGRYQDFHRWLDIVGLPYRRKLLFLGNYIERGSSELEEYSIECLSFVAALKIAYPRHVFMLRGSAETVFSFAPRFNVVLDDAVLLAARQMCNYLPLVAVLDNKYMAVSSGLSPHMVYDPLKINSIERPIKPDYFPLFVKWILFGQPSSTTGMFDHNKETKTFRYGLKTVEDICQRNEYKAIIRSRNELTVNPFFLRNRKLVTISSCPTKNSGGVAVMIEEGVGWMFFKLKHQTENVKLEECDDSLYFVDET